MPLTYSQLVVIRVTHEHPAVTNNAAAVLRNELSAVLAEWLKQIAVPVRPTMEVLPVGSSDDFPFTEIPRC
jgi:hypothetical protein